MKSSLLKRFIYIAITVGLVAYYLFPLEKAIKLGLDLQGGTSYTLKLDLSKAESHRKEAVDKAIEIIRKRVDRYGVSEPIIQPAGDDRIIVQIPGLNEAEKASAREQLSKVAHLEFRMVHPQNESELAKIQRGGRPPAGYEVKKLVEDDNHTKSSKNAPIVEKDILVKIKSDLTGKHLVKAAAMHGAKGYEVHFQFDSEGAKIFGRLTREHVNERLGILLDDKVISAPNINTPIEGGQGYIEGSFDYAGALSLANSLENPLEYPIQILEERGVDPSLGADSIKSGILAGVVGMGAVILFIAIYYLRAGLIAIYALCINVVLLMGVLAIFKFTLTLPGVAGIILTVAIAVDANVLIYERIREELRKGKPFRAAVDAGFNRATTTIIDANVTTLITALVLSWLGTGPVQGFGYTLSIGICTSVFTAVIISRFIFDLLLRYTKFENLTMLSFFKQTNINFLAMEWVACTLSLLLIAAGVFSAVKKGNEIYGVDFTGGDALTVKFAQRVEVSDLRHALEQQGLKESFIQYQRDLQGKQENLLIKVPFNSGEKALASLTTSFPKSEFKLSQMDKVGGMVGNELQWKALQGLLVSALGILVYITFRFEFAFAVGVIIALIHDVLICLALFFLTDRQLSLTAIGALLTIAGYSLNDKIVVFDRIREELKLKGEKFGFANIINLSVNETLARTLLTSLVAFIASLSLYIFGGGAINDFAFILVVGVITGPYSSVFVANSILLLWHPSKLVSSENKAPEGRYANVG